MKLTSATDFSFRLLIYVGLHRDRLVTVSEVATAYGLSQHHLSKLSKTLINHGILDATRGRDGGIKLAIRPEDLALAKVIKIMEPAPSMINCQSGIGGCCKILPACKLVGILAEARSAFFRVMESYTLADLIKEGKVANSLRVLFSQDAGTKRD